MKVKCGIFVRRAMVDQARESLCYQRINLTFLICLTQKNELLSSDHSAFILGLQLRHQKFKLTAIYFDKIFTQWNNPL